MRKFAQGIVVGAIALVGSMSIAPMDASAMPVEPAVHMTAAAPDASIETVYWRYGWRRYGWRRPYYGWRRPYRWGWRHPYRRFYRW